MQMKSIICIAALATALYPFNPARAAEQMTLADLRSICSATAPETRAACRFFILGAFEGMQMAGSAEPRPDGKFDERKSGKAFCVPDSLSQSAMVQKVMSMADADLKAYPADAQMPAISFVGSVIAISYPCR